MILHLLDDEKFVGHIVTLFEEAFPNQNLYLAGVSKGSQLKYISSMGMVERKVINSDEYLDWLILQNYDIAIIHGMGPKYKQELVTKRIIKSPTALVLWGTELYDNVPNIRKNILLSKTKKLRYKTFASSKRIKQLVKEEFIEPFLKTIGVEVRIENAFKKLDLILTNITGDYRLLSKTLDIKARNHWFTYYAIQNVIGDLKGNFTEQNILIGNSATYSNNHIEIIDFVANFELGSKKIICPLNYGDRVYAKKMSNYGSMKLGKSFVSLMDFLKLEEYNDILNSCSVVILNHVRQQAVGNIVTALYLGKKVFLRKENAAYEYFNSLGVTIFSMDQLNENSLKELLSDSERENNKKLLELEFSKEKIIKEIRSALNGYLGE